MGSDKVDLKKELKQLYNPGSEAVSLVETPPLNCLMMDGQGDPNTSQAYMDAMQALYSVSYTLKFALKKLPGLPDYTVMPLEGLWWADDMRAFLESDRQAWRWTMLIVQPPTVTQAMAREAIAAASKKGGPDSLAALRLETLHEGLCAQVLHIGPYSAEGPTIARLHQYIAAQGFEMAGKHHEIYLGDPRRTAPEKLRTVIRQPIQTESGR